MLTHEEMIGLQSEKHELIDSKNFKSIEEFVLHLIHSFAYTQASLLAKDKKVLDLGCNTGYGSKILYKEAQKVVGVDVSKEAIAIAKKEYANLDIDFHLIDGKKLPFDDDEFDLIISCQVIEHIVDYNIYLNELKRVLSPTGLVIFTTPNALIRLDLGMKPWNKFHVREFNHTELQALLKTHFSDVEVLGLFAKESTYQVERNRLSTLRQIARVNQRPSYYHKFRSMIKKIIPVSILNKIRSVSDTSSKNNIDFDKNFMNEHGIEDFYYRIDELENALDLLALCTNNVNTIKDITKNLKIV